MENEGHYHFCFKRFIGGLVSNKIFKNSHNWVECHKGKTDFTGWIQLSETYYLLYTIPVLYQRNIQCHSKYYRPILLQCKDAFQIHSTPVWHLKMLVWNIQVYHFHKIHHQSYSISRHQFEWEKSNLGNFDWHCGDLGSQMPDHHIQLKIST